MSMLKQILGRRYVRLSNRYNRLVAFRSGLEYEHQPDEYDRVTAEINDLRARLNSLAAKIAERN